MPKPATPFTLVKPNEKSKNKGGRPHKMKDDPETLKNINLLAGVMCSQSQAGAFFNVTEKTFREFLKSRPNAREAWELGKDKGLAGLRTSQFALAQKNATMAIFLGQNYLGQKDMRGLMQAPAGVPQLNDNRRFTLNIFESKERPEPSQRVIEGRAEPSRG